MTMYQLLVATGLVYLVSAAIRLEETCNDHGQFACHKTDPTSFTRCLKGHLYEFYCPGGLHFNTQTQTCDWPESADCTYILASSSGTISEPASKHKVGKVVQKVTGQKSNKYPWWRPKNVDPSSWEDTSNLLDTSAIQGGGSKTQGQLGNLEISSDNSGSSGSWNSGESGGTSGTSSGGTSGTSSGGTSGTSSGGSSGGSSAGRDGNSWESSVEENLSTGGDSAKSSRITDSSEKEGLSESASGSQPQGHHHPHGNAISSSADGRPDFGNIPWNSGECNSDNCRLPDCFCPGSNIPNGLTRSRTPQMVMLTFDDEVSAAYYGYFQRLFRPGRYNPNGCPVRGCLFVSGSGTDYDLVYPLYAMGVEVASHTLSHRFPHTWWSTASYKEYYDEVMGMKRTLSSNAGIPYDTIRGFRVPFLQLGGDNMYQTLYDGKFTYDTSMFTGAVWEGGEPVWPFTLDYVPNDYYCQHGPCPTKQYPGLWEIPVQRWYGVDGHSCAMADGCTATADVEESLTFLRSNFLRYYHSNRAPFGIFVHARWFHTEHHIDALDAFIDELMEMNDVYIVTPSQVVEWMKNPTPLGQVQYFGPWSCEGSVSKK